MSGIKRKKKNVKGRGEGDVTFIFVLNYYNSGGEKFLVS